MQRGNSTYNINKLIYTLLITGVEAALSNQ